MKKTAWIAAVLLGLACIAPAVTAAESGTDWQVDQRLGALNSALDELNTLSFDKIPEQRAGRGERLNQAFVALTGEAVNPLFGVTALGMYRYFSTPDHLREKLPLYDQPTVWIPLACIILLMLFNSTLCEAFPPLKVPLNALGDIVNKAGAVAVLPLVIKMFADQVAAPAAQEFAGMYSAMFPTAYAGEALAAGGIWMHLGWLAGAVIGAVIYGAVWLTFNVIDVLILICPFPGVDAMLKSFRLSIMGILAGSREIAPTTAFFIAAAIVLVSLFLAGWSFRLSVFGFIFSTDILLFRKKEIGGGTADTFSCAGMKQNRGIPMRTWGKLLKNDAGELVFSYRPWLVLPRREAVVGKDAADFCAGRGLLNPFLVAKVAPDNPWLRLPPRYRGKEENLAAAFGLRGVVDCGVSGAFRTWLAHHFGGKQQEASA